MENIPQEPSVPSSPPPSIQEIPPPSPLPLWQRINKTTLLLILFIGILISGGSGYYVLNQEKKEEIPKEKPLKPLTVLPTTYLTRTPSPSTPLPSLLATATTPKTSPTQAHIVSFTQTENTIYLRYNGKIYIEKEGYAPNTIQLPNEQNYTWSGIVNTPENVTGIHNEILSFKIAPNAKNFIFVLRYSTSTSGTSQQEHLFTYYYDTTSKNLTPLFSVSPVEFNNPSIYQYPIVSKISSDGKYISFNMFGCWNCGGHQPETLVFNLTTKAQKNIGKTSFFAWKENGAYEYKEYKPTPCPTPPGGGMEGECPTDPNTLPLRIENI